MMFTDNAPCSCAGLYEDDIAELEDTLRDRDRTIEHLEFLVQYLGNLFTTTTTNNHESL